MQEFGTRVTGSYRNDTMIQHIREAVKINRTDTKILNNRVESARLVIFSGKIKTFIKAPFEKPLASISWI